MRKGAWETKSLVRTNIRVWFYFLKVNHLTFCLLTESFDVTNSTVHLSLPFLSSASSPLPPLPVARSEREKERERGCVGKEGRRGSQLPGLSRLFTEDCHHKHPTAKRLKGYLAKKGNSTLCKVTIIKEPITKTQGSNEVGKEEKSFTLSGYTNTSYRLVLKTVTWMSDYTAI